MYLSRVFRITRCINCTKLTSIPTMTKCRCICSCFTNSPKGICIDATMISSSAMRLSTLGSSRCMVWTASGKMMDEKFRFNSWNREKYFYIRDKLVFDTTDSLNLESISRINYKVNTCLPNIIKFITVKLFYIQ